MRDATQVLAGVGRLYIAPSGTAFPLDPSVAPDAAFIDQGYTDEGVNLVIEQAVEELRVEEEMDPVDLLMVSRNVRFESALAQFSLENLKNALGGGTITTAVGPPATKTYVPPDSLSTFAVLFRGTAPTGSEKRDIQITQAKSVAAITIPNRRAPNKQVLGIAIRAKKVTGTPIFKIVELT